MAAHIRMPIMCASSRISDVPGHLPLGGGRLIDYFHNKKAHRKYCGQLSCNMADFLTNFLANLAIFGGTPRPHAPIGTSLSSVHNYEKAFFSRVVLTIEKELVLLSVVSSFMLDHLGKQMEHEHGSP